MKSCSYHFYRGLSIVLYTICRWSKQTIEGVAYNTENKDSVKNIFHFLLLIFTATENGIGAHIFTNSFGKAMKLTYFSPIYVLDNGVDWAPLPLMVTRAGEEKLGMPKP